MFSIASTVIGRANRFCAKQMRSVVCAILTVVSLMAGANPPEGLDFIGGYYDKGEYKCYSEPCFSIHRGKAAAADKRARPFYAREWAFRTQDCQKALTESLSRASKTPVRREERAGCSYVVEGEWVDLYSGGLITDVSQLSFDQLISYEEAHSYGASYWSKKQRLAFINDARNIVPVVPALKQVRAGRPPTQWMPEDKALWCDYIYRREIVRRSYNLHYPQYERDFEENLIKLYCKY